MSTICLKCSTWYDMKRIQATILAQDVWKKSDMLTANNILEIERYEEKIVPKEKDVLQEHSFEALLDAGKDFLHGIWLTTKGFVGMSKFAIIMIITGLRYLWSNGVGKKKEQQNKKEQQRV